MAIHSSIIKYQIPIMQYTYNFFDLTTGLIKLYHLHLHYAHLILMFYYSETCNAIIDLAVLYIYNQILGQLAD